MEAPILKELYNSPNGDRWALSKDGAGKLVVLHEPNKSSGGRPSEVAYVFLSEGDQGPEHQAWRESWPPWEWLMVMTRTRSCRRTTPRSFHMLSGWRLLGAGAVFRKRSSISSSRPP